MSALVSYDSSSEEEEASSKAPSAQAAVTASITSASSNVNDQYEKPAEVADSAPVMGPSIPKDGIQSYHSYEDDEDLSSLSERDAIRYLTQATHPMTELPRSPPGSPEAFMTDKFKRFLELKAKGVHFNEDLARKHTFKNPSLLSTMMARAGVDGDNQYCNSLPTDVFDPTMFPSYAYKEDLLRSQQSIRAGNEFERKAQSVTGKRSIDFAPARTSETSSRNSTPGLQVKRRNV